MLKLLLRLFLGFLCIDFVLLLHETGHFIAAKLLSVRTEAFSIGLGPKLAVFGKDNKYRLSLIPIGGYVRFDDTLFSPLRSFLIYIMGPLMNIITALLFFLISSLIPVERLSDPCYVAPASDYPALFEVIIDNPLRKGDLILSSGNTVFDDFQSFLHFLDKNKGQTIPLTILRDGSIITLSISSTEGRYGIAKLIHPVIGESFSDDFLPDDLIIKVNGVGIEWDLDLYQANGEQLNVTVLRDGTEIERYADKNKLPFSWKSGIKVSRDPGNPFLNAIGSTTKAIADSFCSMFNFKTANAFGSVRTADYLGNTAISAFSYSPSLGARSVLRMLSLISVSLAVINLLPLPPADGGEILLSVLEAVLGRQLKRKSIRVIGLIVLGILTFHLLVKDILFLFP